jgi:putative ABC transport system permease protein
VRLEQQYPDRNKGRRVRVLSLYESVVGDVRQPLLILLGAVGLVVVDRMCQCHQSAAGAGGNKAKRNGSARSARCKPRYACAATADGKRVAGGVGAVLGLLLAFSGTSFIAAHLPNGIPRLQEARVDARVLVFTLAVSLLTGLLFGLAPALQASRSESERRLERRRARLVRHVSGLRSALVVSEVALTLMLLVGAGLLMQSFRRVLQLIRASRRRTC